MKGSSIYYGLWGIRLGLYVLTEFVKGSLQFVLHQTGILAADVTPMDKQPWKSRTETQ